MKTLIAILLLSTVVVAQQKTPPPPGATRPKIEALTPADIQRAAARYFDTYRAAIVIVGDWEKVKDQVTPFGDVTMYDAEGRLIQD